LLFVHLAHLTKDLRFGCGFNITPMWHPLRLAEDYATADILTGGRVRFGVGRGYHTREVETFDAPIIDQDANRELFEEQVEVLFKAFNNRSFSHRGKHYDIPPRVPYRGYTLEEITLVPRPRHLPVECWQPIVSASQRALDFMAKYGIKGMIGGGAASGGASDEVVKRWQETLARHGKETELGGDLIISFSVQIADTQQKAMDEARQWVEERIKMFGPLGFVAGLTPEQLEALADPRRARSAGLPTIEDGVRSGSWLCGPPELVAEKLMEIQDKYPGLEEVNIGVTNMGMPLKATLEQLEWFGKEVMPRFTAQARVPASAD
jgi:alkanesulfonate monooxygenase SsuD/methylene tetrahydromethanopterin reductase-like flavin-dependent oxidoreductase (luciferase family)